MTGGQRSTRQSYDRVARHYADALVDELSHKPLDRALLAALVEECGPGARVADVGCGPGHVAEHLRRLGAEAVGLDLSPGMVHEARRRFAGNGFVVGSLTALPVPDASWDGAVCFYTLIHLSDDEIDVGLAELARVLRPGAWLLLAFHVGAEARHLDEWWGERVDLDFRFLSVDGIEQAVGRAGLAVQARLERRAYAGHEVDTRRAYVLARRPGPDAPVAG